MRALVLSLGFVLGLVGSFAYAQDLTEAETAELELARQIALQLNQPAPTSVEAAQDLINSAPANVVLAAVTTVSNANPGMAAQFAAAAARNNNGVSVAAAADAADVPVNLVAQNMGNQENNGRQDAEDEEDEGQGGAPSREDIIATLEEDEDLADDFEIDDDILDDLVEEAASGSGSNTAQN